jgi:MFS family permease
LKFAFLTAFNAGCAAAPNMESLIIMRFLAGTFGSSPLTNAGGVVADIWSSRQRGIALVAFSSGPLFGPVLGPVIGGFISENCGWRWAEGFL